MGATYPSTWQGLVLCVANGGPKKAGLHQNHLAQNGASRGEGLCPLSETSMGMSRH
jgi:hypothetical protein